jgi:hypothetical protein
MFMSKFTVELEYSLPRGETKALAALLRKAPRTDIQFADPLENGGLVVRVDCEADDLWQAIDGARRLVESRLAQGSDVVTAHTVRAVRATPVGEHDRFVRLVGIAEIAELYGVTRQRASNLARTTSFPRPVQTLRMGPVFSRRAVLRHRNQRHYHAL